MDQRTAAIIARNPGKIVDDPVARARKYDLPKDEVRVNPELGERPSWMKVKLPAGGKLSALERKVHEHGLHTVCESANCPNKGECWSAGTATLMILGNICTRSCGFCSVKTGRPTELDLEEPGKVAQTVEWMGLRYVVITSVDRDDLRDGGSGVWAETIRAVRDRCPETGVEVLIPDFKGKREDQERVFAARPHVLAHNLETVKRLHATVRPQAEYQRSLDVLRRAKEAGLIAKSGMMLGIGERVEEVEPAMRDLRDAGCEVLTLGQYLQPTLKHLPIERWVHPDEFGAHREAALAMGFSKCDSGPLVRSSYHAEGVLAEGSPLADVIAQAVGGAGAGFTRLAFADRA
jgi:lipoic acid synthetase